MALNTSALTAGSNNFQTTPEHVNQIATDFVSPGVLASTASPITNTAGTAPASGGYAVNAVSPTPNNTVIVSPGTAYAYVTPTSQTSQAVRIKNTANVTVTIATNTTGSTVYDWIYVKVDPTNAANPSADGTNVSSIYVSRSTSSTVDTNSPATYGQLLAVVTVANGFVTILNGNIADKRATATMSGSSSSSGMISSVLIRNFVESGGIWSIFSGLNGSMTAITVWVNGKRVSVASIGSKTFTASQDTYIDVTDNGTVNYVAVANNATTGMTLSTNTDGTPAIRIAKVVTSGTAIVQILQSSINLAPVSPNTLNWLGFDPLGNSVYNVSPSSRTVGRAVNITSYNTNNNATAQAVPGMSVPVIVPANAAIEIDVFAIVYNTANGTGSTITVWDGAVASGTQVATAPIAQSVANQTATAALRVSLTPTAGVHTYNVGFQAQGSGGTSFIQSSTSEQATITVKLA